MTHLPHSLHPPRRRRRRHSATKQKITKKYPARVKKQTRIVITTTNDNATSSREKQRVTTNKNNRSPINKKGDGPLTAETGQPSNRQVQNQIFTNGPERIDKRRCCSPQRSEPAEKETCKLTRKEETENKITDSTLLRTSANDAAGTAAARAHVKPSAPTMHPGETGMTMRLYSRIPTSTTSHQKTAKTMPPHAQQGRFTTYRRRKEKKKTSTCTNHAVRTNTATRSRPVINPEEKKRS